MALELTFVLKFDKSRFAYELPGNNLLLLVKIYTDELSY